MLRGDIFFSRIFSFRPSNIKTQWFYDSQKPTARKDVLDEVADTRKALGQIYAFPAKTDSIFGWRMLKRIDE